MVGPTSVGLQLGRFQRGKLPTCVSQTDCREAEKIVIQRNSCTLLPQVGPSSNSPISCHSSTELVNH